MNHNERFIATVAECEALASTHGHSLGRWHRLSKQMHASICVVCNEMTWVMHSGDGGGVGGAVVKRLGKTVGGGLEVGLWGVKGLSIVSNEERRVRLKERLGRTYEWFLTLPRPLVLTILWLAGVALVGLCALALYLVWQALRAGA